MLNPIIIRNDEDVRIFEETLMMEAGKTRKEWYQETDPDDPPFRPGDKVWVDNVEGVDGREAIEMGRKPQTVERVWPMPCSDGPLWSIDLVGIPYLFTQHDMRKA